MAKDALGVDPKILAAFDAMIAAVPGVERKGATLPYTSINGNMYACISKAGVIGLRLSASDLTAFLAKHKASLFEGVPGYINKEYAAIPEPMLSDTTTLRTWFRKSHANASSLKPKKTTR
jgi:hypothetical protein